MKCYFINILCMHYTLVHLISSHAVHVAVYHCKQISGLIDLPREVKTHTVGQHGWQTCLKQGWLTYSHVGMECASSHTPSSERNTVQWWLTFHTDMRVCEPVSCSFPILPWETRPPLTYSHICVGSDGWVGSQEVKGASPLQGTDDSLIPSPEKIRHIHRHNKHTH